MKMNVEHCQKFGNQNRVTGFGSLGQGATGSPGHHVRERPGHRATGSLVGDPVPLLVKSDVVKFNLTMIGHSKKV